MVAGWGLGGEVGVDVDVELHPPVGVRVVAFFITARLAAQDTREAFTEVVLEQLAELLGQDLPPL